MMAIRRLGTAAFVLLIGLTVSGCPEEFGPDLSGPASIEVVSGGGQEAVVGEALPTVLSARVTDSDGTPLPGVSVSWGTDDGGSFDPASGDTDANGVVETTWTLGTGSGTQTARATTSGVSGAAEFTATALAGPTESVSLSETHLQFGAIGETVGLDANGEDQYGNPTEPAGTWSSTNTGVATVGSDGTVTAQGNGSAEVRFTGGGFSAAATVEVAQEVASVTLSSQAETLQGAGATVTLTASIQDANGHPVQGATAAWTSLSTDVVTVDAGLVTAVGPGTTQVVAEAGGHSDSAEITVEEVAAEVDAIEASPTSLDFHYLGQTLEVLAVARDADGNDIGGVTFDWSSSNTGVVTVTDGIVTAQANGTAFVTASADGVTSNQVAVTVEQTTASLEVAPGFLALASGGTGSLEVIARDEGGTVIPSPSFSTLSRNSLIVTADGATLTGGSTGVTDVVATSDGVQDSARVAVVAQDGFAFLATTHPMEALLNVEEGATLEVELWLVRPEGGTGGLGSISGTLNWDPGTLDYQGSAGTADGFSWTPNETDVDTGQLTFGSFAAEGIHGTFSVARITFTVLGAPGWATSLVLGVDAAGNADGSTNIRDLIEVVETFVEVQP